MGMSRTSHRCDVLYYSFSQKPDLNTSPTRENRKSLESENDKYLYPPTEALKETYGIELKTLNIIYWIRVCFGILAALICTLLRLDQATNPLLTGISAGLIVYIVTYYVLKRQFVAKVEKSSKVFSMGIGAYFLTWIVAWTLFSTLLYGPPPV